MNITESTVALISGGGSGLGEATARRLHTAGATVVLLDLPGSAAPDVVADLGERAVFAPADVRDEEQVQSAVTTASGLGDLRIAVTCAGVATPGRILGKRGVHPLERYRTVIDINLVGTFNVLRLAAEAMTANDPAMDAEGRPTDRGVVVMTASAAGYDGQIGQAAYASSKGGVIGLTLPAARDLAESRVRVMTIAPGTFETPMMAGLPEAAREALAQVVLHPSRLGRPDEYAQLVEHIVANSMLNGEVIRLDGALRMPPA